MNKMIMTMLSIDELKEVFREVVKQELNPKREKELMTFKETCELLNISPSCLNQKKARGDIPFKKLGKRVLFSRSEIFGTLKDAGNYKILRDIEKN